MAIIEILERSGIRSLAIWKTFEQGFLNQENKAHRTIVFGLYGNSGENGRGYLNELSIERIEQIVAQFDSNMARLDMEQQNAILAIASKRYLDTLEQQIHDEKMINKRAKIDAENQMFDAKEKALEADRIALLTLRAKLLQAITKTANEIALLEVKIAQEGINLQQTEVDRLRKEIEVKKIINRQTKATVRGLEIQYKISELAISTAGYLVDQHGMQQKVDRIEVTKKEMTASEKGMDADVLRTQTQQALIDTEVATLENRRARAELDVVSKRIDTKLLDVKAVELEVDIAMVDVDIKKMETRAVQEEAKREGIKFDIAMVDVQLANLLIDVQQAHVRFQQIYVDIAQMDLRILGVELLEIDKRIATLKKETLAYEIPLKMQARIDLISNDIDVLLAKKEALAEYKSIEEDIHSSKMSIQNAQNQYKKVSAILDSELSLHKAEVKIESYSKDVEIAEKKSLNVTLEDAEKIKLYKRRVSEARDNWHNTIDVAEMLADATLVNTMTHQIKGGK
ncbi:MAG: hypothetical protein B6I31_00810 [Desulfobacteraceae bacterium 4572_19]|nr:MAG: hypothetical protein B6I31_00810 [Desulfobacteraceae bacterium 4572_19]